MLFTISLYRKTNVSPTPTQIQNQLGKMRSNAQNISRQNSGLNQNISRQDSGDSITSSILSGGGRETPVSFRDLQTRYGTPTSPKEFVLVAGKTPMSDIDYQKTARNTVMGELSK